MLEIGSIIEGKYKILNLIGQGGMSTVYLAMNERANKQWAIKEVRKEGVYNYEVVKQGLAMELELLKKLHHPYLPSIADVIERQNSLLIVMDYIEGNTLDRILNAYGPQAMEDVIQWAKQLCEVLNYLHTRKPPIIYRDLKPSNVMLRPNGDICLIDFGTAREYKEKQLEDTTCLGTQGYAAPEQYGGQGQTDERTDIYCLGMTLYHLLTGHNPAEPPYEIKPIREWNPSLSQGLETIILKCTNKNPEERYQNCTELLYDLEHYEELDQHYISQQKKKLSVFGVTCICALMCMAGAIYFHTLSKQISVNSYSLYLKEAKSQPTQEGALDKYITAIKVQPDNEEAYINLLDYWLLEDDCLTVAEDELLRKLLLTSYDERNSYEDMLRANPEGYGKFAYKLGIAYFYSYEESGNKSLALKWLDTAAACEELDASQTYRARILAGIATYYSRIGRESKSGDVTIGYREYWDDLVQVVAGDIAQEDNAITALIVYREMTYQIYVNALHFKEAGVTMEEMLAQLTVIEEGLQSPALVSDGGNAERIASLMKEVEEGISLAKQVIDNTFQAKEENPLLAKGSHFPSENKEENPLLARGSHFPSENKED